MAKFVFKVEERTVTPGEHSWVAIEETSGEEVPLPSGGNTISGKNFVGQYPEIEDFLRRKHQLNVPLIYVTQLDELIIDPNGNSTWTFRRQGAEVIVRDIPRTVARITTAGYEENLR